MIRKPKESLTPKQLKEKFLEKNPKYHEVKDDTSSVGEFHAINEDDEVWMMQCPKGVDVSALKDHKMKLPGRSNQDELETVAVEFPQPLLHAFGHKNKKGHNNIKIIPIQGSIILRSRIKSITLPEEIQLEAKSTRVPMPNGIKQRHPLHGIDYESKLEINPEIAKRLKLADEVSVRASPKKKAKSKSKTESSTIAMNGDSDVELVIPKKSKKKKKKRKHASEGELVENSTRKKKKKNSVSDDVSEDLQWIRKL